MSTNNCERYIDSIARLFSIDLDTSIFMGRGSVKVFGIELVEQIFDDVVSIEHNETSIFYEEQHKEVAEVAITLESNRINRRIERYDALNLVDNDNNLKYEVGEASDYYIVWLYKKIFERYNLGILEDRKALRRLSSRARFRIDRTIERGETIELIELMRMSIDYPTLKVIRTGRSRVSLEDAINSYSYTIMCNLNKPIKVYNIEEILPIYKYVDSEANYNIEAPKRKYNHNLIDYYNLALSSIDPFVSYISYYHIIEYFYDEVYREHQIEKLRTSITSPSFSYKDDGKLFNIIEAVIKDNKTVRDNGSGNEQQSLNYVLNKYIDDIEEFKARFNSSDLDYYKDQQVTFSKGNIINWQEPKEKVIKAISNRLYKTRNSLIHSKSSKKDVTYHPYSHRGELIKEINLIKNIAEKIIEEDSECIM